MIGYSIVLNHGSRGIQKVPNSSNIYIYIYIYYSILISRRSIQMHPSFQNLNLIPNFNI